MAEASAPTPWLLLWQGLLPGSAAQQKRLSDLAGIVLILLMAGLPVLTRAGLGLIVLACGALWVLWSLTRTPTRIGSISGWLLLFMAVAVLATGLSPVPIAAAKGLLKLISYLGVYALMRQLLNVRPEWWDRLVAALLGGSLLSSLLALRQLYAPTEELARWADPNSVAEGTIRIYGPLGNPNLLAGYLVPILPIAVVAMIRWRGWGARLYAATAVILGCASTLFSYSRGGWLGIVASVGVLMLLCCFGTSETGQRSGDGFFPWPCSSLLAWYWPLPPHRWNRSAPESPACWQVEATVPTISGSTSGSRRST